jgi:hypothetical protein
MIPPLDADRLPPIQRLDRALNALIETLEFNGFLDLEVKVAVAALSTLVFIPIPDSTERAFVGDGSGRVRATREECIVQWRRIVAGVGARPPRRYALRAPHDLVLEALTGFFVRAVRTQVGA